MVTFSLSVHSIMYCRSLPGQMRSTQNRNDKKKTEPYFPLLQTTFQTTVWLFCCPPWW